VLAFTRKVAIHLNSVARNYERYIELARAAMSAGDAIQGENLYQEHDSGGGDQRYRA
jgi:hypothetical protein